MPLWRDKHNTPTWSRDPHPSSPQDQLRRATSKTGWPFQVTDKHPHPSDLDQTALYDSWNKQRLGDAAAQSRPSGHNPHSLYYSPDQVVDEHGKLRPGLAPKAPFRGAEAERKAYGLPPEPREKAPPAGPAPGPSYGAPSPGAGVPPRPQLPGTAPITPPTASQLGGLPSVPNYYSGIRTGIADPYADMYPGGREASDLRAAAARISDAVVGKTTLTDAEKAKYGITGTPDVRDVVRITQQAQEAEQAGGPLIGDHYWDDVQGQIDQAVGDRRDHFQDLDPRLSDHYGDFDPTITDRYEDFDPTIEDRYSDLPTKLTDHYTGLDSDVPDYYEHIGPVGYEHYLGLDPTQPDYYEKLDDLIEKVGFEYDPLTTEQKRKLAEEYASIQVDPQISAINRAREQAQLDADSHGARIIAANSGYEEALARREQAKADKDLESAIARGAGRAGAVEWLSAERQGYHLEKLSNHEAQQTAELTAIANQLGLTKRQMEERKIELEAMRGQLTNQELQRLREQEWERQVNGANWMFEASLAVADRLAETDRWTHEQSAHIADRLVNIDTFNAQQEMNVADRKTALDQWMKEMDMSKADRKTSLEQWEQERQLQIADRLTSVDQWMKEMELSVADRRTALDQWMKEMDLTKRDREAAMEQWEKKYELEVAYNRAQDDARFREWETNARMGIGDRKFDAHLKDFHMNLELRDRTYKQAVDEFARELNIADRLTQRDMDEMSRALDVFDRTQLSTAQQYQLWITLAEVTGTFPDRLPGT